MTFISRFRFFAKKFWYLRFRETFAQVLADDLAFRLRHVPADFLVDAVHHLVEADIFRDDGAVGALVFEIVLPELGLTN